MQYLGLTYTKKSLHVYLKENSNSVSYILSNNPMADLTWPQFSEDPKHIKDWLGF